MLQKEVEIGPDDTLGDVYFSKIFPLGVDACVEAADLIAAGNAPRITQDESKATYESWCKKADARIDWKKPGREVYNLIRGCNPVSYTHLRAHETVLELVCRLLLEKKNS